VSHTFYITASYAIAAVIVAGLIGWTWLDGRARKRELATLEASGFRRRPARTPESDAK
jgi:heme exporter protein D